jgi:hypothetical protein
MRFGFRRRRTTPSEDQYPFFRALRGGLRARLNHDGRAQYCTRIVTFVTHCHRIRRQDCCVDRIDLESSKERLLSVEIRRSVFMSRRALCVLLCTITAPAILIVTDDTPIGTAPAHAAAACSAAPKPPAPQGSHWYYRTDRATQRRCWYLAAEGQKVLGAAPRLAARAPAETESDAAPSPEPAAPQLTSPAALRVAEAPPTQPVEAPTPQSPEPTDAAAGSKQAPTIAVAPERGFEELLRSREERATQPPAAAAGSVGTPAAASTGTLPLGLLAVAALGLFTGSVLYLAVARRRRTRVAIVDLNVRAPLRMPATPARPIAPRRPPTDDSEVDAERLRQFAQAWKRQAA